MTTVTTLINYMAVLCGMLTIQHSTGSARLYLICDSLGPPKSSMQTASRLLQIFAGFTR